ncbi:unnamed protein product [Hermetia illucens]|uniref:dTMP kinase n=2 Tax=Hermetia illucens TaxID=343691 RepID=A0A7R8YL25_HERIL|nr:unnamed protein product [Hermetia illucens]
MKQLLVNGTTLIVDRYSYSGVAFSTTKGLDLEWCKGPETGLPRPDRVFFLQINPTALENRGGFGNERFETTDFQEKVLKIYKQLHDDSWVYIDAFRDRHVILKEIADQTLKVIEKCKTEKLSTLW